MKYKKALKILGYWLLSSCMFFGTAMLFVLLFSSFSSLGPIFGLMFLPEFR